MIFPKVYWNDDAQPDGLTLDRVLYQVRFTDGMAGLLLDAVCIADILEDSDGEIALDALVSPFARLPRKMELLRVAMERVGATVKPSAVQITEPFKQRGVANVAAVFELSDGQTVSIFFHNPDVTPNKMAATDEVISWKWLLNKKDVTIVVAPERGVDLNVREVARRMMRLAEKNSAAFMRANVKRGDRMAALEGLRSEIVTLTKELDTAKETLATLQDAAQTSAAQRAPNSGGEDAPAESPDVFAIGSVKFQAFAVKIRQGKQRVWGIRVLENGKEMNPADGNGAGFKSDTKASMIEDMERSYAAITKIGDKAKNENRWREGFGLAPLPAEESSTSNEQALIDAYIKAWGNEAAIVNAAVASVNWEGITDNASATAEIQKLQSAAKGERLIIKARDALEAAGMETWDSRLSGVTETEEFQAQSKAMDAYREAMDKIQAIAKEKLIEAGKAELAALPEDAPLGDVARAIYRKHGIDMGWGSRVVTAIEAKDAALAWSILSNLDNKASIEIFERATGIKLAKTQKGRAKQIDEWAGITTEKRAEIEAAKDAAWKQEELERSLESAWGYLASVNVRTDTGEVIDGNAYLLRSFADGYTQALSGSSKSGGAATVFVMQDEARGKSRGLKNKAFNAFLKAAIAFGGLREALAFVGASIPEKSAEATEDEKIAAVDAAYGFENATRDFKLWMHESLEKPDYSPFVTAKAMDEAARRNGATIEWGEFGGVAVDSVALDGVKERALYQAAIDADEDFQRELERVYGKGKANSMRMQKKYDDPKLDAARKKKLALEESLRKAWKAGEVVDSAFEVNISSENDNMKSTITFDTASQDQIKHAIRLLKMHESALDSAIGDDDNEDFDEEEEWDNMPDDDDALDSVALDGDFPGHPFRGNQHRKVSRQSGVAVSASVRAKKSEKSGDKRGAAKAHKAAYHAHAAAAEDDSLPSATVKYHKKMARMHAKRA